MDNRSLNPNPNQPPAQPSQPAQPAQPSQPPEDIFSSVDPAKSPPSQTSPAQIPPAQIPPGQQINPPNPTPPAQPATIPPQAEAGNQNATGLENQPILSENYVPEPNYQKAQVPHKNPFGKIIIAIVIILLVGAAAVFFLFFFNKGTLALTASPGEARITIDSKNYARKSAYKIRLSSGEHVLGIEANGYATYQNKIVINSYQTTELKIDLKAIPVAQKLLNDKLEFIAFSADKKYLVGLGDAGKTFYRIPLNLAQNQNNSANSATSGETGTGNGNSQNVTSVQTAQAITENNFANVVNVIWNPTKSLAILKIKNEKSKLAKTKFYKADTGEGVITTWLYDFNRYDLKGQESSFLGNDLGDIVWLPDGSKIIYYSQTDKTLFRASATGTDKEVLKNIAEISNPSISIAPDAKNLTLIPRSKNYKKNYLYLFDLYTKKALQIVKEGNQKGALFNPASAKIVYSTYSEDPNSNIYTALYSTTLDGTKNQALEARALIENVIFFDDNNIVYPSLTDQKESEKLVKKNIETKEEAEFQYQSAETMRFKNILFSENKIYFLSENILYSLELIDQKY